MAASVLRAEGPGWQFFINQADTPELAERGERICRNPQTGEEFVAPPTKKVKFKAFGNVTNYNFKYGR